MTTSPERPLVVAFADSFFTASVAVFLGGLVAALSASASAFLPRFALHFAPLYLGIVPLAAIVPFLWRAARGVSLRSELDQGSRRLLLAGPVAVVSWWVLGHLALQLLSAFSDRPASGGVLLATMGAGIVTFSTWIIERGSKVLPQRQVSGKAALLVFVIALLALVVLSVLVGTTSGSGSAFALFGVFKRPELDLRGAGLFFVTLLFFLILLAWVLPRRAHAVVLVLGGASLFLFGWSLRDAANMKFKTAVAIERDGGLAAQSLHVLQRLSDRDGDGHAAAFGGGDCNDRNASVHPSAAEIYGNDVDENCDGITTAPVPTPEEAESVPNPAATGRELPPDLNVLLLTIDTLRAELGFSEIPGTRPGISPHLDRLARSSTVFSRAYSLASYTSKSLGPMLIGRYPSETPRSFEHFDRFPKEAVFVQERLQKAGIETLSIQGYWYFFFEGYGFERGFDTLEHSAAPRVVAIEGDRTKNGDRVADDTIMYLKQLADRPSRFFMWTHWVDPHAEYVPHEEFDYGPSERERYDAEVSFVDAQVGRIMDALVETKLWEKTVIIVTSDHGEAFAEHGMIRHGFEVWEELVHVPLLIRVPTIEPHRVSERRSLIDVAPTILDIFDVQVEDPLALSGQTLLTDILSDPQAPAEERPVLVDMPKGPHNQERRAFYVDRFKLIVSGGRVLGLYDLKSDPGEKTDLSEDAALLAPVKAAFDAYIADLDTVAARQ